MTHLGIIFPAPVRFMVLYCAHISSLLRPDYLLQARKQFDNKEITYEQLRVLEDKAIAEAVRLQREVGIKSFTDGEYRFYDGFFDHLEGFEDIKRASTTLCTGKIRHVKSGYLPQFEALKALVQPEEVKNIKLTLAAPEWFHLRHGEHAFRPGVYANRDEYFDDIAAAYRRELKVLYAAGLRNAQFDAPLLAYFCSEPMLKGMQEAGEDSEALLDRYIQLYNDCLAGRPEDMAVGLHLCRGNFRHSIHFSEGGYDAIAVKLFNRINNKTVVLGLVTSKFPELEDVGALRERVMEAAKVMAAGTGESEEEALKRICASPQCGFASHSEGNLLGMDDMRKKLALVKDLATSIWSDA
ncbi:UROD/MetE-like protein [Pisolithus sp. B1]|nr:UROD/MetE-like protein [Pisolithus sp. B1]